MKLGALFLLILAADIYTKHIIQSNLLLHQSISIIPDFFDITYVENPGAAFGMLSNLAQPARNLLLGGISIMAIIMLINFYIKYARDNEKLKFALVLVLSGALGNLIDRIRFGVVIDFIDVHWRQYHWPAFNIADSVICVGVGILFFYIWSADSPK